VAKVPSPLADLLGLRYVIDFGQPSESAIFEDGGFSIEELPSALPRAFVPSRALRLNDASRRLARLARPDFDPRKIVYLESAEPLPEDAAPAAGSARFVVDEPEHIELALDIEASGWLVLADRWAPGWWASVDGRERPVLIADHALRAVRVEAGEKRLELHYEPRGWRLGLRAAGLAVLLLVTWALVSTRRAARRA
jgi:hypothetical protein